MSNTDHALEVKLQMLYNILKGILDIVMLFHCVFLFQNSNQNCACSHSVRPSSK